MKKITTLVLSCLLMSSVGAYTQPSASEVEYSKEYKIIDGNKYEVLGDGEYIINKEDIINPNNVDSDTRFDYSGRLRAVMYSTYATKKDGMWYLVCDTGTQEYLCLASTLVVPSYNSKYAVYILQIPMYHKGQIPLSDVTGTYSSVTSFALQRYYGVTSATYPIWQKLYGF